MTPDVNVYSGIGFLGACFILFCDFNGRYDLYDAILYWLMK